MFRTPTLLFTLAITLTLGAAGCGSKDSGPSCAKLLDHTAKLMQIEFPAEDRPQAIANCEKEPPAKRACALKAKTVEELMACQ